MRSGWKRLPVALLAFLLVALGSLSAMAQDSTPNTDLSGEITLWHGWTGAEADTLTNTILPEWQAAYPNVKINVLAVPFDQLKTKYSTEAATGGGPDVLIGSLDWIGELTTGELIQPIDQYVDEATLSQYLPSTVDAVKYDGKLMAMPESFETVAMYYNKALMPTPVASTADMDTLAASVAAANSGSYGLALYSDFYHPAGYFFGFGGKLFNEDYTSAVNSPETVAFLDWMNGLQSKPGYFLQNDANAISSLFKEGKAAAVYDGPWMLGDFQAALGADNVGVAPLPMISEANGAAPAPFVGVKNLMMNSNIEGDQATLAATFMKWFTSGESAEALFKVGHLPANTGVDISGNPIAVAFSQQAETGTPLPTVPQMGQVWEPVGNMITSVLSGDATSADAAKKAQEQIDQAIAAAGA